VRHAAQGGPVLQDSRQAVDSAGTDIKSANACPPADSVTSVAESEYAFLLDKTIDAPTLTRACHIAERWGTSPHDVLIANGWITQKDYFRSLAKTCGTDFVSREESAILTPATPERSLRECLRTGLLRQAARGKTRFVLATHSARPTELKNTLTRHFGRRLAIGTPGDLRKTLMHSFADRLMKEARNGLAARFPSESAATGITTTQRFLLAGLASLILVFGIFAPLETLRFLAGIATVFFALVVCLRIAACINLVLTLPLRWLKRAPVRIPDRDLPLYTILVPLFREHRVLPALTQALARLDYPAAKLDIKLIFESIDKKTLEVAKNLNLPGNFEFIIVPDAQPRTKPKALNYALQFARGDFAVIYDAEDRPDSGQLRAAMAAFHAGPPNLACLQARLNFYNARENWLTRQFAIEYTALFDGLLPALQRMGLPIPLGGTSNHFRISALKWLGAWDAYNVTEDADLGMRLYRRGYICRMLDSTTQEEATCSFSPWLKQRTRWLKGYMQTYFVHMRRPFKLWRELGTPRFLGFQVMIGGLIFSALIHPVFYVLVGVELASHSIFAMPQSVLGIHLWLIALFNVALGFLASMGLALLALRWRGARLALHVPFMPPYWLMISLAGYRALLQLMRAPFYWEKTEHGVSRYHAGVKNREDRQFPD